MSNGYWKPPKRSKQSIPSWKLVTPKLAHKRRGCERKRGGFRAKMGGAPAISPDPTGSTGYSKGECIMQCNAIVARALLHRAVGTGFHIEKQLCAWLTLHVKVHESWGSKPGFPWYNFSGELKSSCGSAGSNRASELRAKTRNSSFGHNSKSRVLQANMAAYPDYESKFGISAPS